MVILDTCAIIFMALAPERLGKNAEKIIHESILANGINCSDISLWEIAMLIEKKRLDPGSDYMSFINNFILATDMTIMPITPEIASFAASAAVFEHGDPADRIIASTAICHNMPLITCDEKLMRTEMLHTIW